MLLFHFIYFLILLLLDYRLFSLSEHHHSILIIKHCKLHYILQSATYLYELFPLKCTRILHIAVINDVNEHLTRRIRN